MDQKWSQNWDAWQIFFESQIGFFCTAISILVDQLSDSCEPFSARVATQIESQSIAGLIAKRVNIHCARERVSRNGGQHGNRTLHFDVIQKLWFF